MSERIRVSMALDLFVEDATAMADAAYERMRAAWNGDDEFPYSGGGDIPRDRVVNSLLADALPLELPGCHRGRLVLESVDDVGEERADDSADSGDDDSKGSDDGGDGSDAGTEGDTEGDRDH